MTPSSEPLSALEHYSLGYQDLFHDRRLFKGFQAILSGILSSGSTRVRQIARAAPQTGCTPHSERRFRRLIHAQPQRADLSLDTLEAQITAQGAKRLAGQTEVRVLLDGSDLRKPHSSALECLSTVRALDGDLIAGYPTLNAVGVGRDGQQALLYHHTYSPLESGFKSEGDEVKHAIETVTRALRQVGVGRILWILDRGFDDAKIIAWLLERHACFIIRAQHNRKVRSTPSGKVIKLFETVQSQPPLGTLEMLRPVQQEGKRKKRLVTAVTRSTQVWLSEPFTPLGVVNLQFQTSSKTDPDERGWILLTNLPLETAQDAQHIVALYASRWAIEEIFAWTKTALEWRTGPEGAALSKTGSGSSPEFRCLQAPSGTRLDCRSLSVRVGASPRTTSHQASGLSGRLDPSSGRFTGQESVGVGSLEVLLLSARARLLSAYASLGIVWYVNPRGS